MDYLKLKELRHSGVKGMKWGERRYQNEDGTLTPEGMRRYGNQTGLTSKKPLSLATLGNRKKILREYDINKTRESYNRNVNTMRSNGERLKQLKNEAKGAKGFDKKINKYEQKIAEQDIKNAKKDIKSDAKDLKKMLKDENYSVTAARETAMIKTLVKGGMKAMAKIETQADKKIGNNGREGGYSDGIGGFFEKLSDVRKLGVGDAEKHKFAKSFKALGSVGLNTVNAEIPYEKLKKFLGYKPTIRHSEEELIPR